MKTLKVREIKDVEIPYNFETYILHIQHEFPITQFYRTRDKFMDKLQEYYKFDIDRMEREKNIYALYIKGRLENKNTKVGRPRKSIVQTNELKFDEKETVEQQLEVYKKALEIAVKNYYYLDKEYFIGGKVPTEDEYVRRYTKMWLKQAKENING